MLLGWQVDIKNFKKYTKWHVACYWVDTCTFKKNLKEFLKNSKKIQKKIQKNHEVTRDSHYSWPLMI